MRTKEGRKRVKNREKSSSERLELLQDSVFRLESELAQMKKDISHIQIEEEESLKIPISIFSDNELGTLECIVKYLRENRDLSFREIASLLFRDNKLIWTVYNKAYLKHRRKIRVKKGVYFLPTEIFSQKKLGVLEICVVYLKEEAGLKYSEIGMCMNRDQRTVWTCYDRACKKMRKHVKK